jgi:hypothetical protein
MGSTFCMLANGDRGRVELVCVVRCGLWSHLDCGKGARSVLRSRKRGGDFVGRSSMKILGLGMFWQEEKWFWRRGGRVSEAKSRFGDGRVCVVAWYSKELGN